MQSEAIKSALKWHQRLVECWMQVHSSLSPDIDDIRDSRSSWWHSNDLANKCLHRVALEIAQNWPDNIWEQENMRNLLVRELWWWWLEWVEWLGDRLVDCTKCEGSEEVICKPKRSRKKKLEKILPLRPFLHIFSIHGELIAGFLAFGIDIKIIFYIFSCCFSFSFFSLFGIVLLCCEGSEWKWMGKIYIRSWPKDFYEKILHLCYFWYWMRDFKKENERWKWKD